MISAGGQGFLRPGAPRWWINDAWLFRGAGEPSTASFLQANMGLQLNNGLCLIFTRTSSSRYDYFLHFILRGKKCLERLCHVSGVAPGPWEGRQGLKLRSLNGVTTDPHALCGGSAPGHQRGKPWTPTCCPVSGCPSEPAWVPSASICMRLARKLAWVFFCKMLWTFWPTKYKPVLQGNKRKFGGPQLIVANGLEVSLYLLNE